MKQYEITLKGEALVLAIDSGLVKESRFGKTDISAFLRFWDAFEPELKNAFEEFKNTGEMFNQERDSPADN